MSSTGCEERRAPNSPTQPPAAHGFGRWCCFCCVLQSYACRNKNYKENPPAEQDSQSDMTTWTQRLLVGPSWASALGQRPGLAVLSTTAPVVGGPAAAKALAVGDTTWALAAWADESGGGGGGGGGGSGGGGGGGLLAEHRREWHRFYSDASFLSIDHPRLEQFYWITQYKLGSGMGLRGDLAGDGGAMDHTSPWFLPNNVSAAAALATVHL